MTAAKTDLDKKMPTAVLIAMFVIFFYKSDNMLDYNTEDLIKIPQIGVKKAYVIGDIYKSP